MSKPEASNAGELPAPDRGAGQRPILLLVFLFLLAFAASTIIQIKSHRDADARRVIENQGSLAAAVAHSVDANISRAHGANAAAAEILARHGGRDGATEAAAQAAALPGIVHATTVFDRTGAAILQTAGADPALAAAALAAAGPDGAWVGAPDMGDAPTAPAIVRRVDQGGIVAVLDPDGLAPALASDVLMLIVNDDGAIAYASPALRQRSLEAQQQIIAVMRTNRFGGTLFLDGDQNSWAVAAAPLQYGGFRVLVAAPAPSPLSLWLAALARYALLAAAPLAAMAVLYILMRQNARRAQLAEAEAQRAETNFRLAADGARAGVMEWRPGFDQVQLSEQASHLLGAESDTMSLAELIQLISPDDRFNVEEEFRRARQSGLLDARFRVSRGAGVAWIEARGAGVEDAAGRAPSRLFCTIIDATPRHEAEARVSRLERQLRAAIESFSGPFALWDTRRRLVLWNHSFANLFDLGPELLRPRASYEAINAAAAARIRREKHDAADPDVRIIELSNGDWLHMVERRTGDGGLVTVGIDISQLKRKEEELARNERRLSEALHRSESQEYKIKALAREAQEERQKAEDASRAKSAFLANMSHELRTPLNAVIGFSEILANEYFGPIGNDQYRQYSKDIHDSGYHLLDLINDILDMAKIEAGKLALAPRPLDPAVVIDQAVRLTRRKAEEKGLSIVVDAEELPEIEADHRAVKQMLLNLLSNAVKFTDEGAIMVQARSNTQGLTLRVADTGCGIPPEHLPRLAQPFQQVEQELSRNHSGTGLGLALTKSLAEMHGGRLNIQSEVGKGTIVTIWLPREFGGTREPESSPDPDEPDKPNQGQPPIAAE